MNLFRPKPNYTFGNMAAFIATKKQAGVKHHSILFYRMYEQKKGKVEYSHEITVDDLPALRALADEVYSFLKRKEK